MGRTEVNGEVVMVEMLAMEAGEVMVVVMIKGTEVAMEGMVVTPRADPGAKPQEVCPGVCVVASKCVGVAAATVDAVAPQETSLIRERGIKTKKKEKLQNMLFPHSESALFKFKKTKQAKTITKYLRL
jgi:hypothetical protein